MRRLLLALALAASPAVHAEYFLDGAQRAELITRGEISGRDGARYNVWIVPGYVQPARNVRAGWSDAGAALADYADPALYRNMADHGRKTVRVARRDILREFAFVETARSVRKSFATASARVDKRVFGWWFAYPWAVLESGTVSVLRVGVGVPTGIAVGVGGVTVLPAAELAWPALRAGYHATVEGTALPLVAGTWNTVVAPPLALLGEQPAEARADGFWMKRITPSASDARLQEMLAALTAWREQQLAADPARAVVREEAAAQAQLEARRQALLRELMAEQRALHERAQARLLELLRAAPGLPPREQLQPLAERHGRRVLQQALEGSGIDEATAHSLLDEVLGSGTLPDTVAPAARRDDDKTDPLRRGVELMAE